MNGNYKKHCFFLGFFFHANVFIDSEHFKVGRKHRARVINLVNRKGAAKARFKVDTTGVVLCFAS